MCRLKWSRSSTFDSSGRDVACWLPQVSVSCADVHGSTNTYMVSMSKRTRQIKWMNDERTYIYKLWTRRAMQTPCLLFALWPSFFQRQDAKLLSMSLFLPSNPMESPDTCPLIRDGSGNGVDAKEAQVYSVRGNAQAEKIANTPFPIPVRRLRLVAPDAKSWRLAAMSCLVRVDPVPMLVME
jgi:hypothetical protein